MYTLIYPLYLFTQRKLTSGQSPFLERMFRIPTVEKEQQSGSSFGKRFLIGVENEVKQKVWADREKCDLLIKVMEMK